MKNIISVVAEKVDKLIEKIKLDGLETVVEQINLSKGDDSQDYFFIYEYEPKFYCVAHGSKKTMIGKTPEKIQKLFSKIDIINLLNGMKDLAEKGKGALCEYKWHLKQNEPVKEKVSWVQPLEYEGRKYFIGSGRYET